MESVWLQRFLGTALNTELPSNKLNVINLRKKKEVLLNLK
jgi:hypothetical protein